jgi:chemotaxis protein histidine kinase CheA/ActR/RegA family two-component response regulator
MDQLTTVQDPLEQIREALQLAEHDAERLPKAVELFSEIAAAGRDAGRFDLASFADVLGRLLQVVLALVDSEDTRQEAWQVRDFVRDAIECLEGALQDDPESAAWMAELSQQAEEGWGDCLELIAPMADVGASDGDWHSQPADINLDNDTPLDCGQIGLILDSLGSDISTDADETAIAASESTRCERERHGADYHPAPRKPVKDATLFDSEIRDAFLDDAQRCLASIEASLLAYEEDPAQSQPLKQVCRELHTLKGASASVGLKELADFLHQVEDDLQAATDQHDSVDLQPIFKAVDAVREQMQQRPAGQRTAEHRLPVETSDSFVNAGGGSQDSVRVKSAQLDRLMDMLAELVMLRNRRESRVEQLKGVHNELVRCVSRLRAYEEKYSTFAAAAQSSAGHGESGMGRLSHVAQHVSSLTEIANDLLDLGGNLRELYEPVGDENLAISRFIRHFRQELIQLRRVPMGGLFQRLQRAARDAARVEEKKVRLHTIGDNVGLESSVQQQLYEPLLHIVRNAVSHGIEAESQRVASGKSPTGSVTLEAHGGANMLVITVRDDGRGLDYDALRRKGVETGLIAPDRHTSRAELARLIFHPGFSTRNVTNEISGRGVGMDVVAAALERMHSWIEVDSTPGQGTNVRLLIPLRSVIEHVMVFRAGGQEFGIPTQFIRYAGSPSSTDTSDYPIAHLSHIFEQLDSRPSANPQLFVLARGWTGNESSKELPDIAGDVPARHEQRLGILVDEIVGPEEVVVRPLPNLLGQQPLFTGVTLSGTGDIMLLFDSKRLLERGLAASTDGNELAFAVDTGPTDDTGKRALVADDSRSARRTIVQLLHRNGFRTDEAADGADALRQLKDQVYDVVFTDLEMPQLNGIDLLREIRTNSRTSGLPVVIVRSRGEDAFRKRAADLGVNDYLTKPVSDAAIKQTLARLDQLLERTSV